MHGRRARAYIFFAAVTGAGHKNLHAGYKVFRKKTDKSYEEISVRVINIRKEVLICV
jgi:hypothetical protein